MNEILIEKFVNHPVSSNCYLIYKKGIPNCIVVDPGSDNPKDLLSFLNANNLKPEYIFLTHHHFDHIWGVNYLIGRFRSKVLSSKICSEKIVDHKLNLSLFYDDKGFVVPPADLLVENCNFCFDWEDTKIKFYNTKGHSESCISILVNNNLFTGDALLRDVKPVTKLPGGNKKSLATTYSLFQLLLNDNPEIMIYPGHGEMFKLANKDLELKY